MRPTGDARRTKTNAHLLTVATNFAVTESDRPIASSFPQTFTLHDVLPGSPTEYDQGEIRKIAHYTVGIAINLGANICFLSISLAASTLYDEREDTKALA